MNAILNMLLLCLFNALFVGIYFIDVSLFIFNRLGKNAIKPTCQTFRKNNGSEYL